MPEPLYTVIGDLVGSRRVADRAAVQDALAAALAEVNTLVAVRQPFEPTVGDEYQGACADPRPTRRAPRCWSGWRCPRVATPAAASATAR